MSVPARLLLDQVRDLCESEKMNVKKMLLRWLIMTIKYFMVNVALAGVLDLLVFRPLEAWLCGYFEPSEFSDGSGYMEDVEDVEDMEDMEDMEDVENMEDPMGIEAGSVVTEG